MNRRLPLASRLQRCEFGGNRNGWSRLVIWGLSHVVVVLLVADWASPAFAQTDKAAAKTPPAAQADKTKPNDEKTPTKTDDRKRFQPFGYVPHEKVITISGRALNEEGEPVAGARIFVIPVVPNGVPFGKLNVLAEGKTDAEGRYRFEDVKVSVLEFAPQAVPRPTEALFQVFGLADGYGYVWRHAHSFRPEKRPDNPDEKAKTKPDADTTSANDELRYVFFAGEPIAVDLVFAPEVRLHGLITDDKGTPLKNAVVQAGLVNSSRDLPGTPPRSWSASYLEQSPRGRDGSFNGFFALPEEFRQTRTDADGRYELRGLPRDCSLITNIDFLPEYDPKIETLETGNKRLEGGALLTYSGELNHTFVAPVTVKTKVVVGPSRQPLANVVVRGESSRGVQRGGSMDRTDAGGIATLKLRPGKTVINVEPAIGLPFLPKQIALEIQDEPREVVIDVDLEPAAEVILEAIEKETGKPIAGVSFLSEPLEAAERTRVQSQLSFVDYPRTNDQGRLRAFFAPGDRLFFVDQRRSPGEFESLEPGSQPIEISSEKPTLVRFEFARRPSTVIDDGQSEPIADELKPLADLLQSQRTRFESSRSARFSLRHNNHLTATLTREQTTQLLDSFASKTVDECLEALRREFPDFSGLGTFEIITDGSRRRVEYRYPNQDRTEVNVDNGEDLLISMGSGTQLDIYDRSSSMIHFLDTRDFWNGPAHPTILRSKNPRTGGESPNRTIRHEDGVWEIVTTTEKTTMRRVIDDVTGFERIMSYTHNQNLGQETRQFFPTRLSNGIAVPKLSIRVDYQGPNQVRLQVTFVDKVELLESLPAETFILEVPSGTNLIDYRGIPRNEIGQGRRARMGVVRTAIPDVIAYCNRREPLSEPVLKVGDAAPNLDSLSWFGANGQAVIPERSDKIVLIDFWGISCGPCVAQLSEVNAAAKHFADSNLLILGLHATGDNPEKVVEFAKKRDLVFPIAIDHPDPTGRSFGKTCASYGVSGIPSSVVIDTSGHVAYIGHFQQAIEVAHKLAQSK